jgi:hypothetical protein
VAGDPSRFEIRIADPAELRQALTRPGTAPTTWHPVGELTFPPALDPIPKWTCATLLGQEIENDVRWLYARWLHERQGHRPLQLPARSARSGGADIEHELAEFLAELGTQLARPRS